MRIKLTLIGLLLVIVAGAAFVLLRLNLGDITQPPPEQVTAYIAEDTGLSHISLPIRLPLDTLQTYANQHIEEVLVDKREKRRFKTRVIGIPITVDGRLDTLIKRRGPVQVSAHNNQLELMIPLAFEARFKGKDNLDPNARTKGSVDIRARFTLGMNADWQPTLKARASYHWVGKPKLRVGPVKMDARDMLGDALEKRLKTLTADLENKVRESAGMRERAAERWHELHQVRQLGNDDTPAWLMVDPQAAYFSPVRVTEDAVLLEFALAAKLTTLIGEVLPPPVAKPLPPLTISPPPDTGFRLQVPVSLNYSGISDELKRRYAGQTMSAPPGSITPLDFRLYSSDQNLVLATQMQTQAPGLLLNSKGWLYLQGHPSYAKDKQRLQVEDFAFTREVNNPLIRSASWVLQDPLRDKLAEALSFDLGDAIEKAKQSIHTRINRPVGDGFVMSGSLDELQLSRIQPRERDLLLMLDARGHLAITGNISVAGSPPQTP